MADEHALQDIRHHDVVAARYDELVNRPRQALSDRVFADLGAFLPARGRRMLDLGAGTGHMTVRFGDRFESAVLVDHSEGMLREARRNTAALRTRLAVERGDALAYLAATREKYDLIACAGFLHHLEPPQIANTLRDVERALARGGAVVLAEPVRTRAAEPALIRWWNAPSMPRLREYVALAPAPDEAPLDLAVLHAAIAAAGLELVRERRTWEIFARGAGGRSDRIAIALLDRLHRTGGVVWYGVLARPGEARR